MFLYIEGNTDCGSQQLNNFYLSITKLIQSNNWTMQQFLPILLLTISNIFMTFAWYGHLKFKSTNIFAVIVVSWGIAFFEYCFQVPANRIGNNFFTAPQLKIMQEVISISVFCIFSILYLKENLKWNHVVAFALIFLAVFFVFKKWD